MLYISSPKERVVIRMGSNGETREASSSYLGELKGVFWALEDTKR